jgi:hypothetical protein
VANGTERKIYQLFAACAVVAALAGIVPRFVPNQEGGFASAATAVLVFMSLLFAATALSMYMLVVTIRGYREISFVPKLAGIGPGVLLVSILVLFFVILRY